MSLWTRTDESTAPMVMGVLKTYDASQLRDEEYGDLSAAASSWEERRAQLVTTVEATTVKLEVTALATTPSSCFVVDDVCATLE